MRKLERPVEPANFAARAASAFKKAAADIGAGKAAVFPSLWSEFKQFYSQAQHGKCGFCEGQVIGLQYGDVEHFQPKAEVHDLVDDPAGWGQEEPHLSVVRGRLTKPDKAVPGYWWLAYRWDNYLLSCQTCNQQWKGNLFPVDGHRIIGPATEAPGKPLLLSPFDDFKPEEHFSYGRLGEIIGLTPQGQATVLTCGLDRPSLRSARQGLASTTHEYMDEMASGDVTEGDLLKIARAISASGSDERAYCGMVRTIFQARARMEWSELPKLISVLEKSPTPDRTLCDC